MKQEAESWLGRALKDLDSAEYNLKGKKYDVAAFLSQQAAEKALKALYILRYRELWKVHDLVKLGEKVAAPSEILIICERLNQHYIATRYPVESEYSGKDVEEAIGDAKTVIEWARKGIGKS